MPYDVSVRQYLQGKGVANSDIGYDKTSGNVTVRNQPFYKPELNMSGTTFSNQNNLDNAYSNYSKAQPVIQPDGSVGTTANTGQTASNSTPGGQGGTSKPAANGGYTNPYTSMIADVMKHLTDTYNQPQQDVYSTPQYAAAKANQDRISADSQRHASESAAGAGLGHSTIMTDRTQHIQNDADQQLATQLVPQIQSQLAQERQQQIANEQNQFNNLLGLSDRSDNQYNSDRTYKAGRQDAETQATGYYNPSGMSLDEINQEIKQNGDAYASATPEQQHELHARNIELNNLLGKTYDSKTGTYSGGDGHVGFKTIDAQQIEQALATGKLTKEAAKYNLDQLKDPNSPTNQAAKLELQMKQLDAKNYPQEARLKLEQLQKTIAEIGKVHKAPQSEADIAADKVKLAVANKELADIAKGIYPKDKPAPTSGNLNLDDYKSHINSTFNVDKPTDPTNPYSPKSKVFDTVGARAYILSLNLSDDQTDQMLKYYGMPTN